MIKYIDNDYPGYEKENNVWRLNSDFEKVAYEISSETKTYIDSLKPTKNSNYYLINAMGAGEVYGSNSRGDYFPRQELMKNHKTFESTPAMVYMQHRNKDPLVSLGQVLFSHFNPDSDRVELVQRIDWDKVWKLAPDWIKTLLQTNQSYNTSMGCRVKYDECSYCGKQNKTVADYCDHLKYNMNQFIDGKKVYAINVEPKFFDNSIVRRGADKVARSLRKVASEYDEIDETTTITKDEELNRSYHFITTPKNFLTEDSLSKISSDITSFNKEELKAICSYELPDILGTTKMAGCDLLPYEYQYIVLNKLGQEKLADEYFDSKFTFKVPEYHTGKPVTMKINEELLEKISAYIPERSFYKPFALYRSLTKEAAIEKHIKLKVKGEILPVNAYEHPLEPNDKVASESPLLSTIATSYGNYIGINKEAGILENILISIFLQLPEIAKFHGQKVRNNFTVEQNIAGIKSCANKASQIPLLENMLNPVWHNPNIPEVASFTPSNSPYYKPIFFNPSQEKHAGEVFKTLKTIGKAAVPAAPYLGGMVSSVALNGVNERRKLTGDPKADKGYAGFAAKHPMANAAGVGVLAHIGGHYIGKKTGLIKKSDDFRNEYRGFLKQSSQEEILKFIRKIPNELFFDLL